MKVVNQLALLVLAPVAVNAQPMTVDCANALHTYVSFAQSYSEYVRKNAELVSQAAVKEDVQTWFEAPMIKLQSEANRNFSKLKKGEHKRNRCTLNYALLQNTSQKLTSLVARKDLHEAFVAILKNKENRTPAHFISTLLASKERLPMELRLTKRKIGVMAQSLNTYQSNNCLEKMISDGDLKALSDAEASEIYAHYLNGYLQSGGAVTAVVAAPLQMSSETSLKKEIEKSMNEGDASFTENLEALKSISSSAKIYLARKSFTACPMQGSAAIKILVPTQVAVTGLTGQTELIYEDASLWTPLQAVQYSDTRLEKFPSILLKNQISGVKTFFTEWAKQTTELHVIAGN